MLTWQRCCQAPSRTLVQCRSFSHSRAALAKKVKKTSTESTEKAILGRPSNNLKMGVVGMPNIGKSSLFNLLTSSSVPAENYPFCTIDPSEARVQVPDSRFDWLCETYNPKKQTPAHLTILDIAGLVRGAAQGAGLGNAFLSNVASVDALYHLVRAFENDDITHVEDTVDPIRDLAIIQDELRLKDEETLERTITEFARQAKFPGNKKKEELAVVERVANFMAQGNDVRKGEWSVADVNVINGLHLLTAKPVIYLANVSEDDLETNQNRWLPRIREWVDENSRGDLILPLSVAHEELLDQPSEAMKQVILAGYKSLQLIQYFTCGADEVRAWTVRDTTKAPQAAGVIHTDFERGFIAADVMQYGDLKELGTEAQVRAAGKFMQKGRDYTIEDGDIVHFKFNVTKKK